MNIKTDVWINGIRFNGFKAAAKQMSLLLGWDVSFRWVSSVVKNGLTKTVDDVTISATPPKSDAESPVKAAEVKRNRPERKKSEPAPQNTEDTAFHDTAPEQPGDMVEQDVRGERLSGRFPILRYPRGEAPVDRGVNHSLS
jgi:hypothetical protein